MQVAALERVLELWAGERFDDVPVARMLREPLDSVHERARLLARSLDGDLAGAHVAKSESVVGGGSAPGTAMPSWAVRIRVPDATAFASRLRTGSPSVVCRVEQDAVVCDVRTVSPDEVPHLARAIQYALEGDDVDEA
jgi:L-seryl-tRNA(Ser) seleniumtransferase